MKKMIVVFIATLICSGFAVGHLSSYSNTQSGKNIEKMYEINEVDAFIIYSMMNPHIKQDFYQEIQSLSDDYPIGTTLWQYFITGGYDTSVKAIAPIQDINGDGIHDVVVTSEENNIRCFSGGAVGTGVVLWTHNIYSGNIYNQKGLAITQDVNGDGIQDVVVGATGGARLVRCLSGATGQTIWTYDTHEYGNGGWVYEVNCKYDYNNDGIIDVLAVAGDDGSGTGPKRAFCLNGVTGAKIWEFALGGAGFAVIGIEDCTGDGVPDVVAGCTDAAQSTGYVRAINGATGGQIWSFVTPSSSVWALEQTDDINGDGIKDVIVGTFTGQIYGLSAVNGATLYSTSAGAVIITRFAKLKDVNGDGHPDFVPAHSTVNTIQAIDGQTGDMIWAQSTADQPWNVARIADVNGDGKDDVLVGTLYNNNYWYFLNGVDGSVLASAAYGEAVDAINAIPDVVNDGSMEMIVGGRNGKLTCVSGGEVIPWQISITADFTATPLSGTAPLEVAFTDLSVAENTTIKTWEWDFDNDGVIDSYIKNPVHVFDAGVYTVSLTVSDGEISDTETKEEYITVVPPSVIAIGNITGGFLRINAEILNKGDIEVTSVNWSITVDGLVFLGKSISGTVPVIPIGGSEVISDTPVVGFGNIIVSVKANVPGGGVVSKTAKGFLLLFVVLGLK